MTTIAIGNFFPDTWVYGNYEQKLFASVVKQVNEHFTDGRNVVLNMTWSNIADMQKAISDVTGPVDNLFLVATVDSAQCFYKKFIDLINPSRVYLLGNFDSEHQYNFFAIVCKDHFEHYNTEDLILKDLKYPWLSYNRKPYEHRRNFIHELSAQDLLKTGIVTLGRQFPGDTRDELYLTIGERDEDYVKYGHWYPLGTVATPHEIPHDLFSLHNWHYWQHHFLHIVGCTTAGEADHLFTNQIDFKPIIGMRPFVINGQTRKYQWWRDQGFRTFESWFPAVNKSNSLITQLVETVKYVNSLSIDQLQNMYNDMLPDLLHNRNHWFEWANEQTHKAGSLF
jgi:hypothetical protein